jgi:protein gp37
VKCHDDELQRPLRWRKPRRIFVNSMSDTFHKNVPFEFIDKIFAVAALCPQHTFQILTKRPERAVEYFARTGKSIGFLEKPARQMGYTLRFEFEGQNIGLCPWPLRNVWIGTSCEDQKTADERIPHLLKCPAAIRFLSCEPLLSAIDLTSIADDVHNSINALTGIRLVADVVREGESVDLVIVGGESGPGARPMDPDWARSIRDQCRDFGIAFFMKQMDKKQPIPDDLFIRQFPQ